MTLTNSSSVGGGDDEIALANDTFPTLLVVACPVLPSYCTVVSMSSDRNESWYAFFDKKSLINESRTFFTTCWSRAAPEENCNENSKRGRFTTTRLDVGANVGSGVVGRGDVVGLTVGNGVEGRLVGSGEGPGVGCCEGNSLVGTGC